MSDAFDCNVVLFVFFLVFIYMKFIAMQAQSRSGWNNLTCNPLNLFANSLFQSQEESNKDFERCIVNLSAATTTDLFKKEVAQQDEAIANMSGIQKEYSDLTAAVGEYIQDISGAKTTYTEQVDEIQASQQVANDLNTTTTGFIQGYIEEIKKIFQNITSYFQK
jgi:hypothetical protein